MENKPVADRANSLTEMRKIFFTLFIIAAIVYLIISLHYFTTGLGGTMLLAVTLVPLAYVMGVILEGGLRGAWIAALLHIALLAAVLLYRFRSGAWQQIRI